MQEVENKYSSRCLFFMKSNKLLSCRRIFRTCGPQTISYRIDGHYYSSRIDAHGNVYIFPNSILDDCNTKLSQFALAVDILITSDLIIHMSIKTDAEGLILASILAKWGTARQGWRLRNSGTWRCLRRGHQWQLYRRDGIAGV